MTASRSSAAFDDTSEQMKLTFFLSLLFLFAHSSQGPSSKPTFGIDEPIRFDEWHDLVFRDEKARLDNISIVWREQSRNIIYLVIYAGKTACVGEAKARGIRAKNYLIKRKVRAGNIVWIDGGWKDEVTTEVWIWPPEVGKPPTFPEFESSDVKLEDGCKIKYRGGRK